IKPAPLAPSTWVFRPFVQSRPALYSSQEEHFRDFIPRIAVKSHKTKLRSGFICSLALLPAFWFWTSQKVLAQGVGSAAKARMQEMDRRELHLSDVSRAKHRETDPRAQALMEQVSQDFHRLLELHNRIVRDVTSNNLNDIKFISDATGEIKKRAARLQSTLGLHKPETAEPKPEREVSQAQTITDDLI